MQNKSIQIIIHIISLHVIGRILATEMSMEAAKPTCISVGTQIWQGNDDIKSPITEELIVMEIQ